MKNVPAALILLIAAAWLGPGQTPPNAPIPAFPIADVHISPIFPNPRVRTEPLRSNRYEVKFATIPDLIHLAWGIDSAQILGGPSWLDLDRFDIFARVSAGTPPETLSLMLRTLLRDRFRLVIHNESRLIPAAALVARKKLTLKPAAGSEDGRCRIEQQPSTPASAIRYVCRNVTMEAFAATLQRLPPLQVPGSARQVRDETGLNGAWDFDFIYTVYPSAASRAETITLPGALEQLGLGWEARQIPTPVIVVDSVNEKPSPNPPGVAESIPSLPTQFEAATLKPNNPNDGAPGFRFQFLPGGRVTMHSHTMRQLLNAAFELNLRDRFVGLPAWADTARYDLNAIAATGGPAVDSESLRPLLRALLVDRVHLTWHEEDQPATRWSLVPVRPGTIKAKPADPGVRAFCSLEPAPAGSPPNSVALTCRGISLAQFANQLRWRPPELSLPVSDATGISGSWDFTLIYSLLPQVANPDSVSQADPTGTLTIFEAMPKQLGLKLEKQRGLWPAIVIDRIDQKPGEN